MFKYAIMQYTPQRYMRHADFETQDTMRFSADVCAMCNAINGFEHIQVIGKREKVHISKKHGQKSNVQIDTDYFNGKRVLLIDDICTTCATANAFIEQLQAAGADVRMTLFLAKTKTYRRTSNYQYN